MDADNCRIFLVEYFAKGTAIVMCAAYRLGMRFDAGYVWFLNPWLSDNWWRMPDILPPECTDEEMDNATLWSFTIGHELNLSSMQMADVGPLAGYTNYSYEAVQVFADVLSRMISDNPGAMSVFNSHEVAVYMRNLILTSTLNQSHTCVNDSRTTRPRFSSKNERTSDLWVLKQRQLNFTVPIFKWCAANNTWIHQFAFEPVHWAGNSRDPPSDGSILPEDCKLHFLSSLLGVNCLTALIMLLVFVILFAVVLILTGLIVFCYIRNKRRFERRIRQPYKDLCNELAEIDVSWWILFGLALWFLIDMMKHIHQQL